MDAVDNVFLGLLFSTLALEFNMDIVKLAALSTVVFGVQAVLIPMASLLTGKIGFRKMAVTMQITNLIGVSGLGIFPYIMDPFKGLVTACIFFAVGNGICEAINNPIFESLPLQNKDAEMNRLHSVFSFGQVIVVLVSTLFFVTVGREHWQYLAILFGLVSLVNLLIFIKAPFGTLVEESNRMPLRKVITQKLFIILVLILIFNGPVEMCMANWTSLFAEQGLHVSKTVGDLLGPCLFAVGMGISRLFYGLKGANINLERAMVYCGFFCFVGYMIVVFSPIPLISLIACGLVGISTGIICPGCVCILSKSFPRGGIPMFGIMIFVQYLGNTLTNSMIGRVTEYVQNTVPSICLKMFPVTDPYELGMRTALFFVALMAFFMFVFIWAAYRYIKAHNIHR
jgi:Major Facilitator Superfamily.